MADGNPAPIAVFTGEYRKAKIAGEVGKIYKVWRHLERSRGSSGRSFRAPALLVDRSPQVVHLAAHLCKDLVKVPLPLAEALHAADPLPPHVGREHPRVLIHHRTAQTIPTLMARMTSIIRLKSRRAAGDHYLRFERVATSGHTTKS